MTKTLVATPDPGEVPALYWTIEKCPRCGTDEAPTEHTGLRFEKLERQTKQVGPAGEDRMLAYWAPCPANGQPVLMSIAIPEFIGGLDNG